MVQTDTPSPAAAMAELRAGADAQLVQCGFWQNPYFAELEGGRLSLPAFRKSQEQFYFAVAFFSRPMAALIARSPDYASRIDLLRNVVEEHGEFRSAEAHANTFGRFLETLGSEVAAVSKARPLPAVHAFNSILYSACMCEELEIGIACLGIIEHAFATVSARLGQMVVARGWVPAERLVHYALHAELDIRHADEFFQLLAPRWGCAEKRELIERGLALGAYAFDQLYRGLHAYAARR